MFESGVDVRDRGKQFRFCRVVNNGEGQRRHKRRNYKVLMVHK